MNSISTAEGRAGGLGVGRRASSVPGAEPTATSRAPQVRSSGSNIANSSRKVFEMQEMSAVPARARERALAGREIYEARLARRISEGGPGAAEAAMALLEHRDPPSLEAAAAIVRDHRTISPDAFDCLADAWETYRHIQHQSLD